MQPGGAQGWGAETLSEGPMTLWGSINRRGREGLLDGDGSVCCALGEWSTIEPSV